MPHALPFAPGDDEDAIEDAKIELRSAARAARAKIKPGKRAEAARAIARHLLDLPEIEAARCVSIYASSETEPGTMPTIEALADRGVRVLIPLLGDGLRRCWAEFSTVADLVQRAPGRPPEPSGPQLPQSALRDADVIVVPALGVARDGMRLGQGGGWYDRVLADAREGALVIAVAFASEVLGAGKALPRAAHDRLVDAVVTPRGVVRLG